MANSPILDAAGNPMRSKAARAGLEREIAGPSVTGNRSIMAGHPASGISPQRMARILREAESGSAIAYYELAEQMEENDLHYLSVLGTRKRAVLKAAPRVEPAGDDAASKRHAEVIEEWLKKPVLKLAAMDIMDAVGKAVSHCELIWGPAKGGLYLPVAIKHRDPRWFEFDAVDGETSRLRGDDGQLLDLPPMKFIRHVVKAKSGTIARGGLARPIAWYWMFKNYSMKDWVSFLELYGHPLKVGRYDAGASEGDVRKLKGAVSALGTEAGAVFPRTMDIEVLDQKAGTSPASLWGDHARFINDEISKAVLGQTSSADAKSGGLGSGQADLHGEVRSDLADWDRDLLAATLNRDVVRPIIDWNFGPQEAYPEICIEEPEAVDVKMMVESAGALAALGVEIDAEEVREKAGLPAPKAKGAKLLRAPGAGAAEDMPGNSPQEGPGARDGTGAAKKGQTQLLDSSKSSESGIGGPGADRAAASAGAEGSDADPVALAADEFLSDWDEQFEALFAPLEGKLAAASSHAEMLALAAAHLQQMDVEELALRLGDLGFAAALAGEVDAKADELR